MNRLLSGYGLLFDSDIAIAGMVDAPEKANAADISIRLGPIVRETDQPVYRLHNGQIIFTAAGVGSYHIGQNMILIERFANCDIALLQALLIATALPTLLWLRGGFVLHAAGILLKGDDGMTVIAGPSGSGKSRLAMKFVKQGATLCGDDSLVLTDSGGTIRASGLSGGLWTGPHTSRSFEGVSGCSRPLPIGRIFLLGEEGECDSPHRLEPVHAVAAVLRNRHRPAISALLRRQGHDIEMASGIVQKVGVFSLPDVTQISPDMITTFLRNGA
jgi:hypothetical protein